MDLSACRRALKGFAGKKVLVIGDLMLDEHIWGNAARVSPEAPVMVVEVNSRPSDNRPGGAANVANNILSLGGKVIVIGVVGDDEGGRILTECLAESGADVSRVIVDPDRPTTRKTRVWASQHQQVVRVDHESKQKVTGPIACQVAESIRSAISEVDAVLLSDYNKGVITQEIAHTAAVAASERGIVSSANIKPCNLPYYADIQVITLNQREAAAGSGIEIETTAELEKAGRIILKLARCGGVVVTRGSHGLAVFDGPDAISHIPPINIPVYDPAGAGDSAISALTMALACGLDLVNAAAIANCSGGAVVMKVGATTTSISEIDRLLKVL